MNWRLAANSLAISFGVLSQRPVKTTLIIFLAPRFDLLSRLCQRLVLRTGSGVPHLTARRGGNCDERSRIMADNEFRISELPPGSAKLVGDAAVFDVDGAFTKQTIL